jgi:hypothetical protein
MLWVVLGVTFILLSVLLVVMSDNEDDGMVTLTIAAIFTALGLFKVLAGVGVIKRTRWGLTLGYVMAALQSLGVPIGTAIGVLMVVALGKIRSEFPSITQSSRGTDDRSSSS